MNMLSLTEYKALNHMFNEFVNKYNNHCKDMFIGNEWKLNSLLESNDVCILKTVDYFMYGLTIEIYKVSTQIGLIVSNAEDRDKEIKIETDDFSVIVFHLQSVLNQIFERFQTETWFEVEKMRS